jgi:hypothetical protein
MKTQAELENQNVKSNMNKRIEMFTNDIKSKEILFETTGEQRYKSAANNLRARRGELEFVSEVWF